MRPCLTTGVGSLPLTSVAQAVSYVFGHYEIPFLPELPKKGFTHHLVYQFLEDFPGWSENKQQIDLEKFNEHFPHDFTFSYLSSLLPFLTVLQSREGKALYKLQVSGPYTVATQVACSDGQKIISHEGVTEGLKQFLLKKILSLLLKFPAQKECLLVIDEPLLTERSMDEILPFLEKMREEIRLQFRDRKIWVGVHSCHQWTTVVFKKMLHSSLDLLSFDYLKNRGEIPWTPLLSALTQKWILWGVVSSSVSLDSFPGDLKNYGLQEDEIFSIVQKSLFSPTCGTGLLKKEEEEKMSRQLSKLSEQCRRLLTSRKVKR